MLDPPALNPDAPDAASVFSDYENGAEFIEDVAAGAATRAVMTVLPGHLEHTWADAFGDRTRGCCCQWSRRYCGGSDR